MLGTILLAVFIVSLLSFVGVLTLFWKANLPKIIPLLVSLATGALLSAAFFDLIPESVEALGEKSFAYILAGIVLFLLIEKFLYWYHCHNHICEHHLHGTRRKPAPFTYLNLIGDAVHNFVDGAIIAVSFLTSYSLGLITTLAVILHEIPQEFGDFGILVYGGFKPHTAILYNFLSALTAFVGAIIAFYFSMQIEGFTSYLLPFAAGGFIYIATVDLLPELHKDTTLKETTKQMIFFFLGILLIYLLTSQFHL